MSHTQRTVRPQAETALDLLSNLDPRSNVLVCGPSMVGKRGLVQDLLAALSRTEQPAVVSTSVASPSLRESFDDDTLTDDTRPCYVVDTVSRQLSSSYIGHERDDTWYVGSPSDLTTLGVATGKALGCIATADRRPRVAVDNITTLLLYNSLERIYRFLHVLNGRVAHLDGITIQLLHTDGTDQQEFETLTQLFDLICRVSREDDSSVVSVRSRETTETSTVELETLRTTVTAVD